MARCWTRVQILENLTNADSRFDRWHGTCPTTLSPEDSPEFQEDFKEYNRAVRRAIKDGIQEEPIVVAWIAARRSLGEYDELQSLKVAGLTRGVQGGLDEADLWIALNATEMIEQGKSVERIRRALLKCIKAATSPSGLVDSRDADAPEAKALLARLRPAVRERLGTQQNLHDRLTALGLLPRGGRKSKPLPR